MKVIKLDRVEDILNVGTEVRRIEIEPDTIIRFMYNNKNDVNTLINIEELRNVYAKSVKKSYAKKKYLANIQLYPNDIKKVCYIE